MTICTGRIPCPPNNAGCAGSPWGYGWDAWQADFFQPAAPLLSIAPWIMVHGNHELCSRAGHGWWRFIDPRPLLAGRDCNNVRDDDNGDYSDAYAVPIGGKTQIIVLDTANTINQAIAANDYLIIAPPNIAPFIDKWTPYRNRPVTT